MAPRDLVPGEGYPEQIVAAITAARACLLVLSEGSNASRQVQSEIELAFSGGIPIVPLRVSDVEPSGNLRYLLAGTHWLDAVGQPLERLGELTDRIRLVLERYARASSGVTVPARPKNVIPEQRTNLPFELTPLVGREDDLASLTGLLQESRLVTVVGVGGVGKTRLARAAGSALLARYSDGVWFVDLASIRDDDLVANAIAEVVQSRESSGQSLEDALVRALQLRSLLLIMDNCEHVIDGAAQLVERILSACAQVRVLATSREALRIAGEEVVHLSSLSEESAVELFTQRARAVNKSFTLADVDGSAKAVRGICKQLDGIPLALELAAAHARALNASAILERLGERFRLLTTGSRTALPRQQTLSATIEWSYDLLAAYHQLLFTRLCAFRGSFSLSAAAAVCGREEASDELQTSDALTALADKSLLVVRAGPETRYRLLETIREFAAQKSIEKSEVGDVAQRHAGYFAMLATRAYDEFDSRLPEGWLDRLAPDIDNFRAALEWTLDGAGDRAAGAQIAADCGPIFLRLLLLGEGLEWCERARSVPGIAPATAGRVEYVASMLHTNLAETERAIVCAERAVSFYRESLDERGLVRALSQVAQLYSRARRFDDAAIPAAEAIRRARELAEPRVLVGVLRRCAYSLPPENIEEARGRFSEALDVARSASDAEEICLVLEWWADREAFVGSYERAIELASSGLESADRGREMFLHSHIASWALALGTLSAAEPHARRALVLATEARHAHVRALSIVHCSPFFAKEDPEAAAMLLGYAMERLENLGYQRQADDEMATKTITIAIANRLEDRELAPLLQRGAGLSDEQVASLLVSALSRQPENSPAADARS